VIRMFYQEHRPPHFDAEYQGEQAMGILSCVVRAEYRGGQSSHLSGSTSRLVSSRRGRSGGSPPPCLERR
jgi:hypothetical protein